MPNSFWEQIATANGEALRTLPSESLSVVFLSASFELLDSRATPVADSARLLQECVRVLRPGGLLFVYGLPRALPSWGEYLSRVGDETLHMIFRYWIALGIDDTSRTGFLKPSHRGLLMFLKQNARKKTPTASRLNTANVKVPHKFCVACKKNLKDWGGKKHLMNPNGTALSDVWHDLPRIKLKNSLAPECVLERIRALTEGEGDHGLHVIQLAPAKTERRPPARPVAATALSGVELAPTAPGLRDQVHLGDCVSFLGRVAESHPEGVFDLAFADPPYNLAKNYDSYGDELADQHYLDWCNAWLDGMARTLKPGGSLFVLNLPKWAIHHAAFLNSRLEFRHWIAWDALSDPRGKLMPAHYALLYYTKPGAKPVFNYAALDMRRNSFSPSEGEKESLVLPPDAPKYCLRAACVKKRKQAGDDEKVELSDIWFDIHRIKHKRDRDAHPCQLPEKLMERIIRLTTDRGGLVFDPFCGAGTTAIAALKLGRNFTVTDLDPNYVRITNEKLAAMKHSVDLFGNYLVPRNRVTKPKSPASKRAIELYLQDLAQKLGKVPSERDVELDRPEVLTQIDSVYSTRSAALKRCKVALTEPLLVKLA